MPQMAPLNWLSLFFLIIIIFLLFNVLNYFSFLQPLKTQSHNPTIKKINWKW
uniref:ATP synthase complex subunit 8 n=1 Tax=Popillia japonica TaxID=7064 RepID=A0A344GDM4_POPJA|nr:ATP synthase F0 subunit 8 [Popillia japonica]AXA13794.1 ATP synthase F0 subunit 8 [Popillia japonica]